MVDYHEGFLDGANAIIAQFGMYVLLHIDELELRDIEAVENALDWVQDLYRRDYE